MQAKLSKRPLGHALAAIASLDLEPIKLRVMDSESGEGWSREHAESVERGYRSYLSLLVRHPGEIEDIVVSKDVDEFWHAHILHTMKYTEDCEKVFGTYLHHNPHVGKRTSAYVERQAALVEKTRRLYQREFGAGQRKIPPSENVAEIERAAYCGAIQAAYCGASLGNEKPAYCGAALQAKDAAYCGAIQAAYCGASLGNGKPAYCGAAVGE